jgi:osmotically-inducible protein OsmY
MTIAGDSVRGAAIEGMRSREARHFFKSLSKEKKMRSLQLLKIVVTAAFAVSAAAATAQTQSAASSGGSSTEASSAPSGSSESLGQHLSDGTITTKVKAELLAAKDVKATHIHVKTRRGTVWLTGSVPSADDKSRAQQVVEGVSGVHRVRNQLKVAEPGSSQ